MKKLYEFPEINITKLSSEDIITISGMGILDEDDMASLEYGSIS